MTDRRSRVLPTTAWILATVVVSASLVAVLIAMELDAPQFRGNAIEVLGTCLYLLIGPVYAITGALIASRRSRNSVAWLLLALAVGLSAGIVSEVLVPFEPPADVSIWLLILLSLSSVSWIFFIFPTFHLLLIFPTGRVLSPRWRPLVWLEASMIGFMVFSFLFTERISSPEQSWSVENPIGFIPDAFYGTVFGVVWVGSLLVLTVSGFMAIVIRYRRAQGIERQQMKWFLSVVSLFAVVYGGAAVWPGSEDSTAFDVLLPVSIMGLGIAVAIALLRYRLYEIDRIISRTVGYALVVGVLLGLVALVAAVVGTRFDDPLVVAATTLGVAALFNPLRRRVQGLVDRRFNRSRYDAELVMSVFVESLRDEIDEVGIVEGWLGVVADTMQPSTAGVWVRS